jgi:hypothetical protein
VDEALARKHRLEHGARFERKIVIRRFQSNSSSRSGYNFHEMLTLELVRYTFEMTIDKILASIDSEIAQLQQARALLSGDGTNKAATPATPKKRKMSAAARKRMGDAQRKRWAKQKASDK